MSTALLPVVKALGLLALLDGLWYLAKGLMRGFVERHETALSTLAKWGPMWLALVLFAILPLHFPPLLARTADSQDLA